jgi:hypothetical protein
MNAEIQVRDEIFATKDKWKRLFWCGGGRGGREGGVKKNLGWWMYSAWVVPSATLFAQVAGSHEVNGRRQRMEQREPEDAGKTEKMRLNQHTASPREQLIGGRVVLSAFLAGHHGPGSDSRPQTGFAQKRLIPTCTSKLQTANSPALLSGGHQLMERNTQPLPPSHPPDPYDAPRPSCVHWHLNNASEAI